jgi:hypothetical protein
MGKSTTYLGGGARVTNWGSTFGRSDSAAYSEAVVNYRAEGNTLIVWLSKGNGSRDKCEIRLPLGQLKACLAAMEGGDA